MLVGQGSVPPLQAVQLGLGVGQRRGGPILQALQRLRLSSRLLDLLLQPLPGGGLCCMQPAGPLLLSKEFARSADACLYSVPLGLRLSPRLGQGHTERLVLQVMNFSSGPICLRGR